MAQIPPETINVELGIAAGVIMLGALTAWILSVLAIHTAIGGLRAELRAYGVRQRTARPDPTDRPDWHVGSPALVASEGASEVSGPHGRGRFERRADAPDRPDRPDRSSQAENPARPEGPAHPSRLGGSERKRVGVGRTKKTEFKFDVADEFEMPFGPPPPEAPQTEKPEQTEKPTGQAAG